MRPDKDEAARLARWYEGVAADYALAIARQHSRRDRMHLQMLRVRAVATMEHYAAVAAGRNPHVSPTFTLEGP